VRLSRVSGESEPPKPKKGGAVDGCSSGVTSGREGVERAAATALDACSDGVCRDAFGAKRRIYSGEGKAYPVRPRRKPENFALNPPKRGGGKQYRISVRQKRATSAVGRGIKCLKANLSLEKERQRGGNRGIGKSQFLRVSPAGPTSSYVKERKRLRNARKRDSQQQQGGLLSEGELLLLSQ